MCDITVVISYNDYEILSRVVFVHLLMNIWLWYLCMIL